MVPARATLPLLVVMAGGCIGDLGGGRQTDGAVLVDGAPGAVDGPLAADAAVPGPDAALPGDLLGTFQFTYYWVTSEADYPGVPDTELYDPDCAVLATVTADFADALALEGTGRLIDGRVLNYWGSCGCPRSPCFFEVDADHPWGVGVQNRALVPFRSIAVDADVIAYGSRVFIAELDGVLMPGDPPWGDFIHDGCVSADDTGGAIVGDHIDFFCGLREGYYELDDRLGLSDATLYQGGERCQYDW